MAPQCLYPSAIARAWDFYTYTTAVKNTRVEENDERSKERSLIYMIQDGRTYAAACGNGTNLPVVD